MKQFFHPLEGQSAKQREDHLMSALAEQLSFAKAHCDHYSALFNEIDLSAVGCRASLAKLPITRKADLIALQAAMPPFAGMTPNKHQVGRIFKSPGPIYEPECDGFDWWRMGQAFFAAGFSSGDIVQNCLSYHLTPGGFIMDSGAKACGCTVIPAGPGQTEMQLELIESLTPSGYCGTPSFLNILLEKGRAQGKDTSSITKALVSGEALTPTLKAQFAHAGIDVKQAYATADIGLIAFESEGEGLVVAEDIIVEIVRPGTLTPVLDGEVGEVVVTSFNRDYPLIRFATGDLSAVLPGQSPCGRTNMRIKGWLGRADQTCKVKGLFVHPEQVERIRSCHEGIKKVRLVVTRQHDNDVMQLLCEVDERAQPHVDIAAVQASIRAQTQLAGEVALVALGALADDGIVIEDKRGAH